MFLSWEILDIHQGLSGAKCHWGMYVLFMFKEPKVTNVSLQKSAPWMNWISKRLTRWQKQICPFQHLEVFVTSQQKITETASFFRLLLLMGKNPAPVEVGSLSHYYKVFYTSQVGFLPGFLVAINRMSSILYYSHTKKNEGSTLTRSYQLPATTNSHHKTPPPLAKGKGLLEVTHLGKTRAMIDPS